VCYGPTTCDMILSRSESPIHSGSSATARPLQSTTMSMPIVDTDSIPAFQVFAIQKWDTQQRSDGKSNGFVQTVVPEHAHARTQRACTASLRNGTRCSGVLSKPSGSTVCRQYNVDTNRVAYQAKQIRTFIGSRQLSRDRVDFSREKRETDRNFLVQG
jgi:hypothetical protein